MKKGQHWSEQDRERMRKANTFPPITYPDGLKVCRTCKIKKDISCFYKAKKIRGGLVNQCIPCYSKRLYRTRALIRLSIFRHYSDGVPACARCKIKDMDVLTLDHINNDGWKDRRGNGSGGSEQLLRRLWKKQYKNNPKESLQVLCMNCNMKKEKERVRARILKSI